MNLNEYQTEAFRTAAYPLAGQGTPAGIIYQVLALAAEAGEVAGKLSKQIRGDEGRVFHVDAPAELGDVLWHLAGVCTELGITLESVAEGNLEKLRQRSERNVIKGDGDNR